MATQVIQGEQPRTNVQVIFVYPSKLEYLIKSYNGFPVFSNRTDTLTGKTLLQADVAVNSFTAVGKIRCIQGQPDEV